MEEYKVKVKVNEYGDKFWWQNDMLHRLDGPAVEDADGRKAWYQNGKLHRLDGPAVEFANGYKAWYIEGKKLTEEEFNNRNNNVEVTLEDISNLLTSTLISSALSNTDIIKLWKNTQ